MFRKGWFSGGLWRPKHPHSLDHLKYLHNLLYKNQIVTENNKGLLVETLRSIAEILIWGDQNDSTVFDFFLEKNMLSFFLKIMKQKCGRYVCTQLLQTLNILFENIRNETSLYYLLSNNHVNSIIVHKFDFSDEEVMAYYISFLKTLSLKLNAHTIHFFYNEHTNDFPLYTEAIKFFNHNESMVRIAVRTLTLNVYKVDDKSMLKFIRDKTAAPYFSNLVWFIGNHVLELDSCVRNDADHQSKNRLSVLVAEHLDHLHYVHDILCLQIDALNDVLTDHLLNRLLIPLYVYSLTKHSHRLLCETNQPHVSSVVSLFLLSQVFLIISHKALVNQLADVILNGDSSVFSEEQAPSDNAEAVNSIAIRRPGFIAPSESLEQSLGITLQRLEVSHSSSESEMCGRNVGRKIMAPGEVASGSAFNSMTISESTPNLELKQHDDRSSAQNTNVNLNITDEEKQRQMLSSTYKKGNPSEPLCEGQRPEFSLSSRPYLEAVFSALECSDNDYAALFSLCLLYALGQNDGVSQTLLDDVHIPTEKSENKHMYNCNLVERLIKIISQSCQCNSKVRLATLEMSIILLKQMVYRMGHSYLQDKHLAAIEGAREESTLLLRNFYKSEEIFLDMFEDEYREMIKKPLNVEYLMMDSNILLPPTGTPLTGIEFYKRLPCGEVERARKAIRVFFLLRDLSLTLRKEPEVHLPLTDPGSCIQVEEVLDLNNSDLIACTVLTKDAQKIRRFLVIDVLQLILVEPDSKRLGWGITKFVGFLQDIEVSGDKDDSRCLHVTVHRPLSSATPNRISLLSAKFIFDDHIRCMAAKQRLTKGRLKARQRKMHQIAKLLELPGHIQPCPSPPTRALQPFRQQDNYRRLLTQRGISLDSSGLKPLGHKPLFVTSKVPGFATALQKEDDAIGQKHDNVKDDNPHRHSSSSPPSLRFKKSEDIPLEVLSNSRKSSSSPKMRKSNTSPLQNVTSSGSSTHYRHARKSFTALMEPSVPKERGSDYGEEGISTSGSSSHHTYLDKRGIHHPTAPKTLRQAEAPAVSLVNAEVEPRIINGIPSPCILTAASQNVNGVGGNSTAVVVEQLLVNPDVSETSFVSKMSKDIYEGEHIDKSCTESNIDDECTDETCSGSLLYEQHVDKFDGPKSGKSKHAVLDV